MSWTDCGMADGTASGAVVAAGAVVGGYFLFKTKDEPGNPPPGASAQASSHSLPSGDPCAQLRR